MHARRKKALDAYRRGSLEEAISLQRRVVFGVAPALARIPETPPPTFNPRNPAENVISYALWGANPRYLVPLFENLHIRNHFFPAWTLRVYLERSVPEDLRLKLRQGGARIILKEQPQGEPPARRPFPYRSRPGGAMGRGGRSSSAATDAAGEFQAVAAGKRSHRSGSAHRDRVAGDQAQLA